MNANVAPSLKAYLAMTYLDAAADAKANRPDADAARPKEVSDASHEHAPNMTTYEPVFSCRYPAGFLWSAESPRF